MTIDISAGRFGPVSLATQDVQNVRQATDRNHIGSIFSRAWDKVADWFCNTNRTEAKKCLFDLYSETTPHHQKVESFLALKGMAGAEYQSRFQIEENETGVRYPGPVRNPGTVRKSMPGFLPELQETVGGP